MVSNEAEQEGPRRGPDGRWRVGPAVDRGRWNLVEPGLAAGVSVRFTIAPADERWRKIGDLSPNGGGTWTKLIEMDLGRADA